MKKLYIVFCFLFLSTIFTGCERTPLSVSFCDKSLKGSGRNVIVASVANDKLYKEKKLDIMLKSDKDLSFYFGEEMQDLTLVNLQKDQWYYVSDILHQDAYDYSEVYSKTYIVETPESVNLYFQAIIMEKGSSHSVLCSEIFELETVKSDKE